MSETDRPYYIDRPTFDEMLMRKTERERAVAAWQRAARGMVHNWKNEAVMQGKWGNDAVRLLELADELLQAGDET